MKGRDAVIVFGMEMIRQVIVFDASDVATESAFWAGILGGTVLGDDAEFHCVLDEVGAWRIGVQFAPNHVAPAWPGGSQQQQIHLDLHAVDPHTAHEEALARGARLLQPAEDLGAEEGFQVYADPAGHPFCIGWGQPSHAALAAFLAERAAP